MARWHGQHPTQHTEPYRPIANYHASSARPAVVDAAEAEENTPATPGSLAENPGETERSAAEFGGAPRSGQRPRPRGQTEARRPRRPRLDEGWGEASYSPGFRIGPRGNAAASTATASAARDDAARDSLSAEGNYNKEEMQEMTRWFRYLGLDVGGGENNHWPRRYLRRRQLAGLELA
ncbi:hypothetical protein THAOC_03369 [Thalassiosira oceanica]|uniref:Uncharacterized protein n=1 Tax=Thalassiosira oceanica TaxID=159749 RepID=K0TBP5_THAOC|nr:hypothetical protein THAOC_03369 [Thalassiosira oceanica]|eukprot:EJK74925.1 hypothetical protein THAOC_03369 [Thalassiosira oceanica]